MIFSSLLYLGVVLCGMALIALIVLGEGARRGGEPLPRALDRTAHALAALFLAGATLLVWSDAGDASPLLDRGGLGLALETWPQVDPSPRAVDSGVRPAQDFAPAAAPTWSGDLSGLAAGHSGPVAGPAEVDPKPSEAVANQAPERAAPTSNPIAAQPARVAR